MVCRVRSRHPGYLDGSFKLDIYIYIWYYGILCLFKQAY